MSGTCDKLGGKGFNLSGDSSWSARSKCWQRSSAEIPTSAMQRPGRVPSSATRTFDNARALGELCFA
jgi:hypothetical protein